MGISEKESLVGNQAGYEIIVRREARLEVQEAFRYYEATSDGLGFEFLRSLDASLQSIKRSPFAYQTIHKEARRVLLRKFPYAIFYLIEDKRIVVLACLNQKRSPIDWLRRT